MIIGIECSLHLILQAVMVSASNAAWCHVYSVHEWQNNCFSLVHECACIAIANVHVGMSETIYAYVRIRA